MKGSMIAFPLIWFLFLALFVEWWTVGQFAALLAFIGLILISVFIKSPKTKRILMIEVIVFLLLLAPLLISITGVPISLFNYGAFIIPAISFIFLYLLSVFFSFREFVNQNVSSP